MNRREALARLCEEADIQIVYAFGSRGRDAARWLSGELEALAPGPSDVDVAVKPARDLGAMEKSRLALGLEDLFGVARVDLVVLPEVGAFLAANAIRGERLFAQNQHAADEYDLYVLRRAGDLAPLERERQALIFGSSR